MWNDFVNDEFDIISRSFQPRGTVCIKYYLKNVINPCVGMKKGFEDVYSE